MQTKIFVSVLLLLRYWLLQVFTAKFTIFVLEREWGAGRRVRELTGKIPSLQGAGGNGWCCRVERKVTCTDGILSAKVCCAGLRNGNRNKCTKKKGKERHLCKEIIAGQSHKSQLKPEKPEYPFRLITELEQRLRFSSVPNRVISSLPNEDVQGVQRGLINTSESRICHRQVRGGDGGVAPWQSPQLVFAPSSKLKWEGSRASKESTEEQEGRAGSCNHPADRAALLCSQPSPPLSGGELIKYPREILFTLRERMNITRGARICGAAGSCGSGSTIPSPHCSALHPTPQRQL